MLSLGFDTLIIDNIHYSDRELYELFEFFTDLDVKNFVFIHDFDFRSDNLTLTLNKFKSYSEHLTKLSPRKSHIKVCANLPLIDDSVENSDLSRLKISKKDNSIFVSIPTFQDTSDNRFATNLNKLLYRRNLFPIFTSFEYQLKSAPSDFLNKLLSVKNCGFAFDINFLFAPQTSNLHATLLSSNIHILPSVSHDLANYVGILKSAEHLISVIGKSEYYKLCSLINHASTHIGF